MQKSEELSLEKPSGKSDLLKKNTTAVGKKLPLYKGTIQYYNSAIGLGLISYTNKGKTNKINFLNACLIGDFITGDLPQPYQDVSFNILKRPARQDQIAINVQPTP
jgi:hypothetical protein